MEWVHMTGKTVDEAKERALDELGVDDRDAEFEIIEEPRSGLFGLTRGEAQVRARVRPTAPRPKQERGRRRSGGDKRRGGGGSREGGRERSGSESSDEGGREGGGRSRSRGRGRGGGGQRDGGQRSNGGQDGGRGREPGSGAEPGGREQSGRSEQGGRGGGRSGGGRPERQGSRDGGRNQERAGSDRSARDDRDDEDRIHEDKGEPVNEASVQEQAAAAEEFLSGLVDAFGLTATVDADEVDDAVEVRIDGDDLGLLIGPKGRTLWALQELTKTVVQRQQGGGLSTRIRVDVSGYRARRKAALERFTKDAAAAVAESGVARSLEPMGAADRKVVHDTVGEIDGVSTRSEGEDPRRRVVITPD